MKLYAIKYLSQLLCTDQDEPFAGVERKLFDTVEKAHDYILNQCVSGVKKEVEDFYEFADDEVTVTCKVTSGYDFVNLEVYEDGDLVETVDFEVVEVEYEADK